MTPREFLEQVVRDNIDDFHANYSSFRHAYNAVTAVDALSAHIYVWARANKPSHVSSLRDDPDYREELAGRDGAFALLRDIAKAQKHVRLTRGQPEVSGAEQVTARATGYGEGRYGEGRYGGIQVVVDIRPGDIRYVETVVDQALSLLEAEMARLGI